MSTAELEHSEAQADESLNNMLRRIAHLRRDLDRRAAENKTVADELDQLESLASEKMSLEGWQSLKVDGSSFSLRRDLQCSVSAADRSAVIEVCRDLGIDGVVTVQTGTIKAFIKEQLKLDAENSEPGDGLSFADKLAAAVPTLAALVSVFEKTGLTVRLGK